LPARVAIAAFGVLAVLVLVVVGQPLITDDAWLHLALGEAYAAQGPWLAGDPLLANPLGPPTPAAWLFDVLLFGVERFFGFTGLRVLHVSWVALILALVWRIARRASGSALVASLATSAVVAVSAYRLIQLRPHLFTVLAALLLFVIAFARTRPLRQRDIALIAVLFAVWANMHAAFLLGPIMLATGAAGLLLAWPLRDVGQRAADVPRAKALVVAASVGGAATLLNPAGLAPHLAFFVAGRDSPALEHVADEWARVDLFAAPPVDLPPSWLSWGILWVLVLATLALAARPLRAWWRGEPVGEAWSRADPAWLALGVLGCALPLVAVRFLWLCILPIFVLCDRMGRGRPPLAERGPATPWAIAVVVCLLGPAFLHLGGWPMIHDALPRSAAAYAQPYHAGKYHANLVWLIDDAELEGTLFAEYHLAGFAGRHLTPRIRTLVNGTLNVPIDVMSSHHALRTRQGELDGERFVDLLDRHDIDLYLGAGLPRLLSSDRPWFHTTAHLERTDGWIPIFRNLNGAIYVRANPRNAANLARVVAFYEKQGIAFDPARGFDVESVIADHRRWAVFHGLVPASFDRLAQLAYGSDPAAKVNARDQLASIYAALGLYERALGLDEIVMRREPVPPRTLRRAVWCLLRLQRYEEAATLAEALEARPPEDVVAAVVADAAQRALATSDEEVRRRITANLPLFTPSEVAVLMFGVRGPSPRAGL